MSTCRANPIFAKSVCTKLASSIVALDPGLSFSKISPMSMFGNDIDCWYDTAAKHQAVGITVFGGEGKPFNVKSKHLTAAQYFARTKKLETWTGDCPFLSLADAQANHHVPIALPQDTTISGYKAWTWDACPDPQPDSPDYGYSGLIHMVNVLAGKAVILVMWDGPAVDRSTAQTTPFIKQLIRTYKVK